LLRKTFHFSRNEREEVDGRVYLLRVKLLLADNDQIQFNPAVCFILPIQRCVEQQGTASTSIDIAA